MLPTHLSGHEPQGLVRGETVAQYGLGPLRNFVYLVLDWGSKKAAIVDPQSDLTPVEELEQSGFELVGVLLTHSHHDHVAGLPELVERFPELSIYVHSLDLHRLDPSFQKSVQTIPDGAIIRVGKLKLQAMHTPGHSAGECCYFLENNRKYLFTGDTLFIRDCGRTDFADGSNEQMFASLQRIKALPADTIILPGHHYVKECASTLEQELRDSAPLKCQSVAELASLP